jgi:hypothetical protein
MAVIRRAILGGMTVLAAPLAAQDTGGGEYACPAREYRRAGYALTTDPEDVEGTRTVRTGRVDFKRVPVVGWHEGVVLEQVTRRGGPPTLRLVFAYTGKDWLFIAPGESLRVLTDGRTIRLTTAGATRTEPENLVRTRSVGERAVYPIDAATLRALAAARPGEAEVQVYGTKARRRYVLTPGLSCAIARFAAEILGVPRPAAADLAPGAVTGGRVATTVAVALRGAERRARPVANVALSLRDSAGRELQLATDSAGAVTAVLPPGRYRVGTPTPVVWERRQYRWDVELVVRPGARGVTLTESNAEP